MQILIKIKNYIQDKFEDLIMYYAKLSRQEAARKWREGDFW